MSEVINTEAEVRAPRLEGRHVRLRPVTPMDYEAIYQISTLPEVTYRWRTRGITMSPSAFADALWQGVVASFVVESRAGGPPIGLVTCDGAQHRDGFAHIEFMAAPEWFRSGIILQAAALLIDYVFDLFPFRKLYFESYEFNFAQLQSGAGDFFQVEGCLRQHVFYQNRYWDQYIVAIYRDHWMQARQALLPLLTPGPVGDAFGNGFGEAEQPLD